MDAVVAAVAALRSTDLPGEPWSLADIAAALPQLADWPGDLASAATTARWLDAVDAGAPLPD